MVGTSGNDPIVVSSLLEDAGFTDRWACPGDEFGCKAFPGSALTANVCPTAELGRHHCEPGLGPGPRQPRGPVPPSAAGCRSASRTTLERAAMRHLLPS